MGAAADSTTAGVANSYYSCRQDDPASCASAIIGTGITAVGGGLGAAALRLTSVGTEGATAAGQGIGVLGGGIGGASDVSSLIGGFQTFVGGTASAASGYCTIAPPPMFPPVLGESRLGGS